MSRQDKVGLKIGVVGCGNIARVHLKYIGEFISKNDIALCDTDALRLEEFAKVYGIEHIFTDLSQMLSCFKPNVVHILTPPLSHKALAVQCLENGSHVLIEKPVCVSVEDIVHIRKAADENKRMVCVDHMRLFDPLVLKAQELIKKLSLGEVINVSAEYTYDYLQRVDFDPAAKWIKRLPGGPFFDIIPHPLCLIDKFLPGLKLEKSMVKRDSHGLENELWCLFSSSAKTATLHMSLNISPLVNEVIVECRNGSIKIDLRNFLLVVRNKPGLPNAIERFTGNFSTGLQFIGGTFRSMGQFLTGKLDPYAGLKVIIDNFYKAVETDGAVPVPLADAARLLDLSLAMFPDHVQVRFDQEQVAELGPVDFFVTGATGFIGRRLVNRLLDGGHSVRILSHRDLNDGEIRQLFTGKVEVVKGNIYDPKDISRACQGAKTVIHLAAAMKGDWNYHLDTTITGTRNLLKAAEKAGIDHLVYISTLNVYNAKKYPRNGIINEEFPYEAMPEKRGNYSHAKLRAEKLVREFSLGSPFPIAILRPGLVYGPGKPAFLQDVGYRIGKKLVMVIGCGYRRLPLVYVDNLIDAIVLAVQKKEKADKKIFNVVDSDYPTQRDFLREYRGLTKEKFFVLYIPGFVFTAAFWMIEKAVSLLFRKKVHLNYKLACVNRNVTHSTLAIKQQLDWKQKVDFNEGVRRCI